MSEKRSCGKLLKIRPSIKIGSSLVFLIQNSAIILNKEVRKKVEISVHTGFIAITQSVTKHCAPSPFQNFYQGAVFCLHVHPVTGLLEERQPLVNAPKDGVFEDGRGRRSHVGVHAKHFLYQGPKSGH